MGIIAARLMACAWRWPIRPNRTMSGTMTVPPPMPSRPESRPPTPPHAMIVGSWLSRSGGTVRDGVASVLATRGRPDLVGVAQEAGGRPQVVGQPLGCPVGIAGLDRPQDLRVLGHELLRFGPHG